MSRQVKFIDSRLFQTLFISFKELDCSDDEYEVPANKSLSYGEIIEGE